MEKNYYCRITVRIGLVCLLALPLTSYSQTFTPKAGYLGQWAFAPGLPHKPSNAVYMIGTYQFGDIDQFMKYNVSTNSWSSIPGVPAIKSEFGFSFVVNNRMFFGGGVDQPGTFTNIVYEFAPPSSFTTVDNIPNGPASAFSFGLGNYGYVGGGYVVGNVNSNTMYRFDPTASAGSQWSTVTTYPGSGKVNCGRAVLNGYGYVGMGRSNPGVTEYTDFWRYDPNTGAGGTWMAMTPFPGTARECPIITPICGKLILMGGVTQSGGNFNDIWLFDPAAGATGTWTFLGNSASVSGPQNGRYGPAYAAYGDSLFLGMGFGAMGANNDWKLFTYCAIAPLPIELVSFSANETEQHQVAINWSTASEVNNDHFEVYRSADANTWELVERVSGAGNSNVLNNYSIVDPFPNNGINYYQLKQVDFNGDVSYFDIASVNVNTENTVLVYPNPVDQELTVIHQSTEPINFDIINSYGLSVMNGTLLEKNAVIPFSTLAPGVYYLRMKGTIETKHKLIKL